MWSAHWKTNWFAIAATLAALINVLFIFFFTSSVFYWDEWDGFVGYLNHVGLQGFDLRLAWKGHNEHRMVISKLFYYGLSFFSTDPRWLMPLSTAVWWWGAVELNRLLEIKVDVTGFIGNAAIVVAACFFFSQIQAENFFWGFEFGWFTGGLGAVGAITSALEKRYARMLAFFMLSYLSLASWPSVVPVVAGILLVDWWTAETDVEKRSRSIAFVGFSLFSVLALLFYIQGLSVAHHERLSAHPSTDAPKILVFAVTLLGLPYATMGFYVCLLMGVAFLALCLWIYTRRREVVTPVMTAMVAYALITALLLGKSRAGAWTWGEGVPFRYAPFFLPGWISLIAAIYRLIGPRRRVLAVVVSILVAGVVDAAVKGFDHEAEGHRTRAAAGECLKRLLAQIPDDASDSQLEEVVRAHAEELKCAGVLYHTDEALLLNAREWRRQGRLMF